MVLRGGERPRRPGRPPRVASPQSRSNGFHGAPQAAQRTPGAGPCPPRAPRRAPRGEGGRAGAARAARGAPRGARGGHPLPGQRARAEPALLAGAPARAHGGDLQRAPLAGAGGRARARPRAGGLRDQRARRRRDRAPGGAAPVRRGGSPRAPRRGAAAAPRLRDDPRPPPRRDRQCDPLALAHHQRVQPRPVLLPGGEALGRRGPVHWPGREAGDRGDASRPRRPHAAAPGGVDPLPPAAPGRGAAGGRSQLLAPLRGDAHPRARARRPPALRLAAQLPAARPVWALDRIYARGAELLQITAHDTAAARRASDHLPIVAQVRIQ